MRRLLLLTLAVFSFSAVAVAGDNKKKPTEKSTAASENEVRWLTLDEVQEKMKKEPRKVYIDIYTDWCGWCKVMDKKTFSNPEVAKYLNKHFYSVKLNAERQDDIRFMGKMFSYVPEQKANMLAVELMRGQMSYPTTVLMEEQFQNPQPVPGYLDVNVMEKVLKYFGENHHKTTKFEDYDKAFAPSWAAGK